MVNNPKLTIYSSSAGSGKTYTLAKEYLKLALKSIDPHYFKHILAVTFTNDAANEMKERIIEYLLDISKLYELKDKKYEKTLGLINQIVLELNQDSNSDFIYNEAYIVKKAKAVFTKIIHHYSDFSISTIDSFIQRIVSSFAIQLDYPFNFQVSINSEEILLTAANNFLEKVGQKSQLELTFILTKFANELAEEGNSWSNLAESIAQYARQLHNGENQNYLEKLKYIDQTAFNSVRENIKIFIKTTDENFKLYAKQFIDIADQYGLEAQDFFRGNSGGVLFVMKNCSLGKVAFTKIFTNTVKNTLTEDVWFAKESTKKELIDSLKHKLSIPLQEIINLQETELPKYILLSEIAKNIFKLALLKQFQIEIKAIKDETKLVHLSEFNKAILKVVANEPIPYVYERIGEKYHHIMIDEFQDTSPTQWHNFLPLIENALANNFSSILVGDPKQAIYGFRGGDMRQILHLYNKQIEPLKKELDPTTFLADRLESIVDSIESKNLNINYRSAAPIVEFNNSVFEFFSKMPELNENSTLLQLLYDENFKQIVHEKASKNAHIEIIFSKESLEKDLNIATVIADNESNIDEDENEDIEKIDPNLLLTINDCSNSGFKLSDIAILCRDKKNAKHVANYLKNEGIDIISSDMVLLVFSPIVNFLTSFLKLLIKPQSELLKFEVISLYYLHIKNEGLTFDKTNIINSIAAKPIHDYFYFFKTEGYKIDYILLQSLPIYDLVENIIYTFNLFEIENEQKYLFGFLDEILKFKISNTDSLSNFMDYYEHNKNSLAIKNKENSNAITITTIHKAKGLQYPVVIIPSANWKLTPAQDKLWLDLSDNEYPELLDVKTNTRLKTATVNIKLNLKNTLFGEQVESFYEYTRLENLNMLYVALTRAETRLYIHAQLPKNNFIKDFETSKEYKLNSINQLLYCYTFEKKYLNKDDNKIVISSGDGFYTGNKNENINYTLVEANKNYGIDKAKIKITNAIANLNYDLNIKQSAEKGNLLHHIFSKVKDTSQVDQTIEYFFKKGLISAEEMKTITSKVENVLKLPMIAPFYKKGLNIANEKDIILPNGTTLRPDRVVFLKEKTIILDYKTGKEYEEHKKQIYGYGEVYRQMGFENIEMYLIYIDLEKIVKV